MSKVFENTLSEKSSKQDEWFESLINTIRADQLQLQTRTADEEKTRMYNNFIEGRHF